MSAPFLTAQSFDHPGLAHGFFSRLGGVSTGEYASLNTGPGSQDAPDAVAENRKRCMTALGLPAAALITNYQIHSANVVIVDNKQPSALNQADALVSKTPGLALGVLTADCMPWLFFEPEANVIGAAHAGWKGALAGVLENTIAAMTSIGADPTQIRAAVGPCLRPPHFEVGPDLVAAFTDKHENAAQFFSESNQDEKRQFDLVGFGAWRLREVGVEKIDDIGLCTLADPARFFSYRDACKREAGVYGRNLSAVALL